jgi:polyhydroxybutyrate depolymerase
VKKLFIALSAILVWTAIPAVSAQAVSVGQSCAKTTLGTRVSTRINKKPVIVVCRIKAGRKQWIRAAVQTITTTTTSTSTTSTTVPAPVQNYTVTVDPNDSTLHTITIEGMQPRTYYLRIPSQYSAATSVPLLLALHSRSMNAKTIFADSQILSSAETLNFIVAGLNGSIYEDASSWNAGNCCTNATTYQENDLLFASTVIDFVTSKYSIDKSRVWAMGHSNGGMMAYRLACDLSDKVTAIAVVTGALVDDSCNPAKPVSTLHIHGNLDPTVPFHGGGKFETPSIFHSVQEMANKNSCTGSPKESSDAIEERYTWNCTSGVETQLVNYQENSHAWEAGYTGEILRFLFAHPRK